MVTWGLPHVLGLDLKAEQIQAVDSAWSLCLEPGKGSRLFNAVYWAAARIGPIGVEDTRFTLPF
jgi:hypothetical protein